MRQGVGLQSQSVLGKAYDGCGGLRLKPYRVWHCWGTGGYSVQSQNVFFRIGAAAVRVAFVLVDDAEPAFLQHAQGAEIVAGGAGEHRAVFDEFEQELERLGGEALAPEFAAQPVGDLHVITVGKTRDVSDDLVIGHDDAIGHAGQGEDFGPMRMESHLVGGILVHKRSHAVGFRVELLHVERFEIGRFHFPQGDGLVAHGWRSRVQAGNEWPIMMR